MTRMKRIKRRVLIKLVNTFFSGTRTCFFPVKRYILREVGFEIGDGTKIVGPVEINGNLVIGKNCWIGKNLRINGNGTVIICDNCDVAPEVTFQTGGHQIGKECRRAGKGENYTQLVGSGTWIGGRVTILGNTQIGSGCVIAGCACVVKDVPNNTLVGGVPAKIIRGLDK